jgi:hypothetical protein
MGIDLKVEVLSRVGRSASRVAAIRRVLEAAGVDFIDADGGGPGVRLRQAKNL